MLYWLPAARVREDRGIDAHVGVEGEERRLGDVALAQAGGRRLLAVDDDAELRVVALAADLDVGDARNVAHDPGHLAAATPGASSRS